MPHATQSTTSKVRHAPLPAPRRAVLCTVLLGRHGAVGAIAVNAQWAALTLHTISLAPTHSSCDLGSEQRPPVGRGGGPGVNGGDHILAAEAGAT